MISKQTALNSNSHTQASYSLWMPISSSSSENQPFCTQSSSPEHPVTMVITPPTSNAGLSSSSLNCHVNTKRPCLQKCSHLKFSLPSEEIVPQYTLNPSKKVKMIYTTIGLCALMWVLVIDCMQVSVRRSREVEDLHSLHML